MGEGWVGFVFADEFADGVKALICGCIVFSEVGEGFASIFEAGRIDEVEERGACD